MGSRVEDAIDAAGGLLENAYAETINLAMPLNDGTKVLIPAIPKQQTAAEGEPNPNPVPSGSLLININTASASQLQELPGIGESKAQAILDYRESYGPFSAIEQLMNVSGIGPATFERLKDLITIY
jgi:competence protein ComEA